MKIEYMNNYLKLFVLCLFFMPVAHEPFFITADSTGTHSLYTTYKDYELMFHVSTLLPYTPNNRQQVSYLIFNNATIKLFFFKKGNIILNLGQKLCISGCE